MLRWEEQDGALVGYSGELSVALVARWNIRLPQQKWVWQLTGVARVHGWKQRGYRNRRADGRRAAEKAWARWCNAAGLIGRLI